jgi:hypothetical protein
MGRRMYMRFWWQGQKERSLGRLGWRIILKFILKTGLDWIDLAQDGEGIRERDNVPLGSIKFW